MFSKLSKWLRAIIPPRSVEPVLIDTPEGATLEMAGVIYNTNERLITDAQMYNDGFLSYHDYKLHVRAHNHAAQQILDILKEKQNEC